jgi:hypothetical protein
VATYAVGVGDGFHSRQSLRIGELVTFASGRENGEGRALLSQIQ